MSLGTLDFGHSRRRGRRASGFSMGGLNMDFPLLLTLLAITALGFVVLYSAVTVNTTVGADNGLLIRQSTRVAIGFAVFLIFAQIPPRFLRMWTPWIYVVVIGLLIGVAVEGEIGKGAQRWLDLGIVRFQPSEFAKLAVPLMVAWLVHDRPLPPSFGQLLVMLIVVFIPAGLIYEQPDLGTALLVLSAGGLAILLAGISVRAVTLVSVAAMAAGPLI
jgi:rod shape determining protein RodA